MYAVPVSHGRKLAFSTGIPCPHPAPAEHLVAPPAAEQDADRQQRPGEQSPAAGLQQPTLADPPGDQGGDGEGERHREADVAEVEDRRVEQHQDVVLQQRVGTGSVGHRDGALERIGRPEAQQGEEGHDDEHHDERPADERVLGAPPEAPPDGCGEAGEDHDPQQDRALEGRPHGGDVVEQRGAVRTDLLDVRQREVAGDQCPLHHHDRQHGAGDAQPGVTRRQAKEAAVTAVDAVDRGHRAERRRRQRQHQAGPADGAVQAGGEHVSDSAGAWSRRSAFSASYSLECLTSTRSPRNVSSTSSPWTTTGWHSSKIPPGCPA